jgi:hypothetical protein
LWVIFALLDPDPDPDSEYGCGSRFNDLIESGSETLIPGYVYNLTKVCRYKIPNIFDTNFLLNSSKN